MKSVFLGDYKSSTRGSEGLMYSVHIVFDNMGIENLIKNKLKGLTTDGKSTNTGKNRDLCVRMKQYLVKDLLCACCVAHMSRLVCLTWNKQLLNLSIGNQI